MLSPPILARRRLFLTPRARCFPGSWWALGDAVPSQLPAGGGFGRAHSNATGSSGLSAAAPSRAQLSHGPEVTQPLAIRQIKQQTEPVPVVENTHTSVTMRAKTFHRKDRAPAEPRDIPAAPAVGWFCASGARAHSAQHLPRRRQAAPALHSISSPERGFRGGPRCAAHQPLQLHHPRPSLLCSAAALMAAKGEIMCRADPREHNTDSCPGPQEGLSPLITFPLSHICLSEHQPHPSTAPVQHHPCTHVTLHKICREQTGRQAPFPAAVWGFHNQLLKNAPSTRRHLRSTAQCTRFGTKHSSDVALTLRHGRPQTSSAGVI